MRTVNIYKYTGENGCVVSPVKLGMTNEPMVRLVADEGKMLINGEVNATVIDILAEEASYWTEVDLPEEVEE